MAICKEISLQCLSDKLRIQVTCEMSSRHDKEIHLFQLAELIPLHTVRVI